MTHFSSYARARREGDPKTKDGPLRKLRVTDTPHAVTREQHCKELSLTFKPRPGEHLTDMFTRLAIRLKKSDATVLKFMIYGPVNASAAATEAMRRVFGKINWPVTWVEGAPCDQNPIAGVQLFAFSGGNVNPIILNGRVVGSVFDDGHARFCILGGIGPGQIAALPAVQTEQALDQLQEALAQAKFCLGDVVRTWFFLDDLLEWYDAFNAVRARV